MCQLLSHPKQYSKTHNDLGCLTAQWMSTSKVLAALCHVTTVTPCGLLLLHHWLYWVMWPPSWPCGLPLLHHWLCWVMWPPRLQGNLGRLAPMAGLWARQFMVPAQMKFVLLFLTGLYAGWLCLSGFPQACCRTPAPAHYCLRCVLVSSPCLCVVQFCGVIPRCIMDFVALTNDICISFKQFLVCYDKADYIIYHPNPILSREKWEQY